MITLESGTALNCDCRSAWLKEHWKQLKLGASNEIARFFIARFSADSLNDNFDRHLQENEPAAGKRFGGKSQLEDLFIKQSNLTYEQLIELNLNRISSFEQTLDQVKCREQAEPPDADLFLVKGVDEKFDAHQFANHKFNLNYLAKIERRRGDRKQSVLDAFQQSMRSCVRSLANKANNLFNEINYLPTLTGSLLAGVLTQKFIVSY